MKSLKNIIFEQRVSQAIRDLVSPIKNAVFNLDFDFSDERETERAEDWEKIQTQIEKFFSEFPQFKPETEKELNDFEKWLNKNKRLLTPNNALAMISKAYMGEVGGDVKFISKIQKLLSNLVEAYKDDIFAKARADDFEIIIKQILINSKGDINKAKEYLLDFVIKNFNKISKYKLGVSYGNVKGVENPLEYNSNLIAKALELPVHVVEQKIRELFEKIEKNIKKEKDEELSEEKKKFVFDVLKIYAKKTNSNPNDKQVIFKVKEACIKVLKLGYDLMTEYEEAVNNALNILLGKSIKKETKTDDNKMEKIKKEIENIIIKNPPVAKLNKKQLEELPKIISSVIEKMNFSDSDNFKDIFIKAYPYIVDEIQKLT